MSRPSPGHGAVNPLHPRWRYSVRQSGGNSKLSDSAIRHSAIGKNQANDSVGRKRTAWESLAKDKA